MQRHLALMVGSTGSGVGASFCPMSMSLIPRLQKLVGALEDSGMRWCLLRPPAMLTLAVGDIDLLVEPASLDRIRALLVAERFTLLPLGGRDLHAADYDRASDRFLWLHIQTEYRVAREAVAARTVLDTVRRDPLPRPADELLFWIVLLHDILDKREIPDRHRPELARLAETDSGAAAPLRAIAARHGLDPAASARWAREGRWDVLVHTATSHSHPTPSMLGRIGAVPDRVARLRPRRGLSVAIVGPDGAGKTTLVSGLQASLPVPTRVLYMGLTGGRLPRADALRVPGLVLAARLVLLWLRYGLGFYHRARGRIVLFDRYTLDGKVPSGAPLGPLARLSRRVQAGAVPTPDLVLRLDASGEAMHSRKGEYDAGRLESWRAAYRKLDASVRGVQRLDAEQTPDAVRRAALALIWTGYAERQRRRR
jgi:thymidylate kinase